MSQPCYIIHIVEGIKTMKHDTMTAGQKEKEGGYIIQTENLSDSMYKQKQNLFLSKAFNRSH